MQTGTGRLTFNGLLASLLVVAGVGLVSVGVSGLVAEGMAKAWGPRFVAGDGVGVTYTPGRCADFREYHPEATTCNESAAKHHTDEVVGTRLSGGVLGLLVLGAGLLMRRRTGGRQEPYPGFTETIGASSSGVVATALLMLSALQSVGGWTDGVGANLSAGLVALLVFAGFSARLLRIYFR